MEVNKVKFDLPSNWEEASRQGNDKQVVIQLYHLSPFAKVSPDTFKDIPISSNERESVSKLPVPKPSGVGSPAGEFYTAMQAFIDSGFAPSHMTKEWLDDLHKKQTQIPGAEIPDESDITANISIVKYDTKEMAKQAFDNTELIQTDGFFNVPVVGGPTNSAGEKMSYMELFTSDIMKPHLTKEQQESITELQKKLKEVEPEFKEAVKKTGLNYKHEQYLGYEAIYSEMPNNTQPSPSKSEKNSNKNKFSGGGGYGNNAYEPLPKIEKPYSATIKTYTSMLVGNCVVTGSLISMSLFLPSGNTPCYSLTKTTKKSETVEGIKTTLIVPTVSNYATEGYFNKEDAEKVLKNILTNIEKL